MGCTPGWRRGSGRRSCGGQRCRPRWRRPRPPPLRLKLVQQLAAALGRGAEPVVPHLGDDQLEVRDDGLGTGRPLLGIPPDHLLGQQRRAKGGDVFGSRGEGDWHSWIQAMPAPRRVLRSASQR